MGFSHLAPEMKSLTRRQARARGLGCALPLLLALVPAWAAAPHGPTVMHCGSVPSAILGRSVGYCVALPADYTTSGHRRYPVLYYLHGLFENDRSWQENGGKAVLDHLLAKGEVGDFIVALPDAGESFYVNSLSGKVRYEDFFIREFIPFIDRTYRTIPSRGERALDGDSMGGYGSLHLGLSHANLFSVTCALIPALIARLPNPFPEQFVHYEYVLEKSFGSPISETYWVANSPLTLAKHPDNFKGLKIYFAAAESDRFGFEKGAEQLDEILTAEHVPHVFTMRPGGHDWDFVDANMKGTLVFAWKYFKRAEAKDHAPHAAGPSRPNAELPGH